MEFDYNNLTTEQTNALSEGLDEMDALSIVTLMNTADAEVALCVRKALPDIARAAEAVSARMKKGGRLIYLGAGTSGRLGVLDASECPPTFGVSPDTVIGLIAGGDGALRTAVEGAEDNSDLAIADLKAKGLTGLDSVVAISASGTAAYCIGALEYARSLGALCVSLCCNAAAPLRLAADIPITVVTGPEILSGSTRLKAGTAAKMVLNMLSTAVMVLKGKCYRNLMVDMSASNKKLRNRSIRMIMKACSVSRPEAEGLLEASKGSIKAAIVMHEAGAGCDEAEKALLETGGFTRRAISLLKGASPVPGIPESRPKC